MVVSLETFNIEVAPTFLRRGGGFFICDTNQGGRYKYVDPHAELVELDSSDRHFNGNARKLTRILKQWQRHNNVPLKSFQLEALMKDFLTSNSYASRDEFWFDWLVRDAFAHMINHANGWFRMPLTEGLILLGGAWLNQARNAYSHALDACELEKNNFEVLAGEEWQKIFGKMIPKIID